MSVVHYNSGIFYAWIDGVLTTITVGGGVGPFTAGSVPFSDGAILIEDNAKLFWDNVNKRLGIGTATPAQVLDVIGNLAVSSNIYIAGLTTINDREIRFVFDGNATFHNDSTNGAAGMLFTGAAGTAGFVTFLSTSGAGVTDFIDFRTGNNGVNRAMIIDTVGRVFIPIKLVGGTGTTSTLTFQTTTGVGAGGSDFYWLNGNNGASEAMRLILRPSDGLSVLEINNPTYASQNVALTVSAVGANAAWFENKTGATCNLYIQPVAPYEGWIFGVGQVLTDDFGIGNFVRGTTPFHARGGATGGQCVMQMVGIGPTTIPFPTGTHALILADGTAPSGMGSNTAGVYADDVGGTTKVHIIDEAGISGQVATVPSVAFTTTTTGNIDDLDFGRSNLIRMNNASDSTIRGLKAGYDGQIVSIISIGAGHVYFAHQNAGSVAANRLINYATSASTPISAGVGVARFQYDLTTTRWRLVSHDQGAAITPTYAAGNFTTDTGTWTVDAADVASYAYYLIGRQMTLTLYIKQTSVSGSPTQLRITIPGGFVVTRAFTYVMEILDNGITVVSAVDAQASSTYLRSFCTIAGPAWQNSTNQSYVIGTLVFEVN